jgi:hypothetical protein
VFLHAHLRVCALVCGRVCACARVYAAAAVVLRVGWRRLAEQTGRCNGHLVQALAALQQVLAATSKLGLVVPHQKC